MHSHMEKDSLSRSVKLAGLILCVAFSLLCVLPLLPSAKPGRKWTNPHCGPLLSLYICLLQVRKLS